MEAYKFKLVILLSLALLTSCGEQQTITHPSSEVTFALPKQLGSISVHIAAEQGFFAKYGIDPKIKYYPSGKRALNEGLLRGEADFANTADIPFVFAIDRKQPVKCIATLYYTDDVNGIAANKLRGINEISDLRGKTIATQKFSTVHHFHDSILPIYGIELDSITTTFAKAEELADLLYQQKIDAFTMREPYLSQAIELLGDDVKIFKFPHDYIQFEVLLTTDTYLKHNPQIVEDVLSAIIEAELYIKQNPDRAIQSFSNALGVQQGVLKQSFSTSNARINLPQSALSLWERQLHWAQLQNDTNGGNDKNNINIMQFIDTSPLATVSNDRVSIITDE
ncbi:ABC transporter substrate-binding protein [Shewanella sp. WXL01]|uniref:ABC transporter substrate-binding protein n=1 Tax=Shewanella sp. WXL01 TaxID=2709721 RepID=UPI0014382899|nr:ABC transporter substrate-binding protein [Shewanella sp. WXL01]NKF50369.1 ABC transporter substrate-binding protein [Shewanella sp. WXL01]